MGKFLITILLMCAFSAQTYAQGLELSDVIKNAREEQHKSISDNNIKSENIKPVKNNTQNNLEGEQNACEKINPQELIKENNRTVD